MLQAHSRCPFKWDCEMSNSSSTANQMHTVHTVREYGAGEIYGYMPEIYIYPAFRLRDIVKHVRDAMEEGIDKIAVFDERGNCDGLWINEAEPEPDGEGGWTEAKPEYVLHRSTTDAESFNRAVSWCLGCK